VNKIGSHPGVRDDLFKRPLDQTLITDFFGGVAQAEVVSEDEIRSLPDFSPIDDGQGEAAKVTPRREMKSFPAARTVLSQSHLSGPLGLDRWRDARAWASVLLVTMLIGWVSWRGK
jgi:GPI-anchor transamidase subunit K